MSHHTATPLAVGALIDSLSRLIPTNENPIPAYADSHALGTFVTDLSLLQSSLLSAFTSTPAYALLLRQVSRVFGVASWAPTGLTHQRAHAAVVAVVDQSINALLERKCAVGCFLSTGIAPECVAPASAALERTVSILRHLRIHITAHPPRLVRRPNKTRGAPPVEVLLALVAAEPALRAPEGAEAQAAFRLYLDLIETADDMGAQLARRSNRSEWVTEVARFRKQLTRPLWIATDAELAAVAEVEEEQDRADGIYTRPVVPFVGAMPARGKSVSWQARPDPRSI